jgi:hypothetical protein
MSVTPIGPDAPADPAADGAAADPAGVDGATVDPAGVLQAATTTDTTAVRTSPRIRVARFLD